VPSVLSPHAYAATPSPSPTLTDKKEPEGMPYGLPVLVLAPPLPPAMLLPDNAPPGLPPPPNVPASWHVKLMPQASGLAMDVEPPDVARAPPDPLTPAVADSPPGEPPAVEPASRMCDCIGDEEQAKAVRSVSNATYLTLCPDR